MSETAIGRTAAGPAPSVLGLTTPLSWQPALRRAQACLEAAGIEPDEAHRLSRSIVVRCAQQAEPGSSEEAIHLAMDEARTLLLGRNRP
jgi:hypothetical protein